MGFKAKIADPKIASAIHGWSTLIWLAISIPLAIAFGSFVIFVSWLSLYAIVVAHWSSWQAVQTEKAQSKSDELIREALARIQNVERESDDVVPLDEK